MTDSGKVLVDIVMYKLNQSIELIMIFIKNHENFRIEIVVLEFRYWIIFNFF